MPVLLYVLAVAVFAQGTSEFVLAGLVPGISTGLGVSIAQAGYLTSGFAVGMVVGAPLTAAVGRRLPPRWTLSACLLVFVAAHVAGALTDSFAVLLGTRFVAAVANAGFLAVALSTVQHVVPAGRRARALAVILGGTTLALVAGVPAGALLGELWGWRSALWAIAGVAAATLVAVACLTPVRLDAGTPRARVELRAELGALRSPDLSRHLGLGVLVNGATFCAFTYLAVVVTDGASLGSALVPAVLALFGVGAFAGVSAAGRLADAHGGRLLAVAGPALLTGWVLWAALAPSPAAVWVLAPVQGALSFAVGGTLIARAMAAAHGAPTMGGAFSTVALNLGALAGPVLGGSAVVALGPAGPLVASAVLTAAAVTLGAVTARATPTARGSDDGESSPS
ncbi:Cmx/CmrA family chloramphenicol efflux MFS transporter [Promicromonospora sp. MEB111]|uniref:Cmx/CmrA family chloramphenicol efflux MFS transporter n=1 Tax=Promicromonospora sp. MEB111 TaxID=3040301 RepID=UPI002550D526|nr:Cmx/CmrA family chloramphenicol efflux MFS transporter [Promicromonospora sp. MEB111]